MQQIEDEAFKEKLKDQEAHKYFRLASLKKSHRPKISKTIELLGTGFVKEVLRKRNTELLMQEALTNSPEMHHCSTLRSSSILTSKISLSRSTTLLFSPSSKRSSVMDVILHSPAEIEDTAYQLRRLKSFGCL